ncbi:MAG TPA: pyridoxamine 5'-phosphate oxidase family protein [Sphingobium sp.]|nr:pyridoxamine 5'-phosphate oxidase family protein [Sphingobium sp.]
MKERQHDNPSTPKDIVDRVWELAEKIDICMLTTWNGREQRSRPMSARPRRDEGVIYFLTDLEGEKNAEIASFPTVSLAWADNGSHRYAVVSGNAVISNDRAKITDLWGHMDKIWWEDADDPTIRLLIVTPDRGEIWDSPHALVAGAKMLKAMITGGAPELGDNAAVRM